MGLATPARQPLHPAFSKSFICPPGSLRSHIRQSADPSRLLYRRRLLGAAIWLSGIFGWPSISSKFKDQPGEHRRRSEDSSSRGRAERWTEWTARNACNKLRLRAFRSLAAGWSILCRREVFCARYHVVLEDIASAVLPGWWLRPGCHAFFTVALGWSGRHGVKGGVARQSWYIFRIIPATLASPIFSPPPSVQTYVPSMRSVCCTHIHRCIYTDTLSAAGANTAAA